MEEQNGTVSVELVKEFFDALTFLADRQDWEPTEWLQHQIHQELCRFHDRIDMEDRAVKSVRASLKKFEEKGVLVLW